MGLKQRPKQQRKCPQSLFHLQEPLQPTLLHIETPWCVLIQCNRLESEYVSVQVDLSLTFVRGLYTKKVVCEVLLSVNWLLLKKIKKCGFKKLFWFGYVCSLFTQFVCCDIPHDVEANITFLFFVSCVSTTNIVIRSMTMWFLKTSYMLFLSHPWMRHSNVLDNSKHC